MRAPMQVLVLPYVIENGAPLYCTFCRSDMSIWQFVAGGGEEDETPLDAAKREAFEEAGIPADSVFFQLTAMTWFPARDVRKNHRELWGDKIIVLPEYMFSVQLDKKSIQLSEEHTQYRWLPYEQAFPLLHFEGDQTALYELNERIKMNYFE